jgi:hypothetical protein
MFCHNLNKRQVFFSFCVITLAGFSKCELTTSMTSQIENDAPEWAIGMTEEQKRAIRREAIRLGKRPSELVHDWILELSEKLIEQPNKAA